jgi:tetratricopeptide (TPR) repeat protein
VGTETCPEVRDDLRELALAAAQMAFRYLFVNDRLALIVMSLVAVNHVERANPAIHVASPFAWLGYTAGTVRMHKLARSYFDRAVEGAKASGDPSALPSVYIVEHLYQVAFGNWAALEEIVFTSLDLLKDGADPHTYNQHTTAIGNVDYLIGRFAASIRRFEGLRRAAEEQSNIQHMIWAKYAVARCHVSMGRFEEAIPCLLEAKELLTKHPERPSEIIVRGLLGTAFLWSGKEAEALAVADDVADLLRSTDNAIYSTITGFVGAAEVYLAFWERAKRRGSRSEAAEFEGKARRICAELRKFCFAYPFARPIYHRYRGRAEHVAGQRLAAIRALRKSVELSKKLKMPFDEAEARFALGRALPWFLGRNKELEEAMQQFERLGCAYHARQVADIRSGRAAGR